MPNPNLGQLPQPLSNPPNQPHLLRALTTVRQPSTIGWSTNRLSQLRSPPIPLLAHTTSQGTTNSPDIPRSDTSTRNTSGACADYSSRFCTSPGFCTCTYSSCSFGSSSRTGANGSSSASGSPGSQSTCGANRGNAQHTRLLVTGRLLPTDRLLITWRRLLSERLMFTGRLLLSGRLLS